MATTTSALSAQRHFKFSFPLFPQFFKWCSGQEKNRIMWTGISLAVHGCFITPVTMMAVMLSGVPVALLALTVLSVFITLVVNLAALPTRIAIPFFAFSVLIDLGVIATAISLGLNFSRIF